MSIRDDLAERWGSLAAAEDVISSYRRMMTAAEGATGAAVRGAIFAETADERVDPMMAEAAREGARALWMHIVSVCGPVVTLPQALPWDSQEAPRALPETVLQDLGDEAYFWRSNAAFAYPLEFAFHLGRRGAFERVAILADVDPYTLKRPGRAGTKGEYRP